MSDDLPRHIREWRRSLGDLTESQKDELEDHLREQLAELNGLGLSDDERVMVAAMRVGRPEALAAEFVHPQAYAWLLNALDRIPRYVSLLGLLGLIGVAGLADPRWFDFSALSFLSYACFFRFFRKWVDPAYGSGPEHPRVLILPIVIALLSPAFLSLSPIFGFLGFFGLLGLVDPKPRHGLASMA